MQFPPKHTQAPVPVKRKRGMGLGTAGALERAVRGYLEGAVATAGPAAKPKPFELWEYRTVWFDSARPVACLTESFVASSTGSCAFCDCQPEGFGVGVAGSERM